MTYYWREQLVGIMFLIVFFFVSFLIVGLVLLQEGKGGGLTGMSTGMDGVMGAKNPLRRMTAWLFVFFVLLAISINWYFYSRGDTAIPEGVALPEQVVMEETSPASGPMVIEAPEVGVEPSAAPALPSDSAAAILGEEASQETPATDQPTPAAE